MDFGCRKNQEAPTLVKQKTFRWQKKLLLGSLLFSTVAVNFLFQNCALNNKYTPNQDRSNVSQTYDIPAADHPIEAKTLTTDYRLQLADRLYITGLLQEIFGPTATSLLRTNVLLKAEEFGGPCSEYDSYQVQTNNSGAITYVDQDSTRNCTEVNTRKPLLPEATTVRQGWMIQTCSTLTGTSGTNLNPSTLAYVLNKIQVGSTLAAPPAPSNENLMNLHRLYFRERPLPPQNVFESLRLMFPADGSPSLDSWKTAIYGYCISSQWQVL